MGCNQLVSDEFPVVDPHAAEVDFNIKDFCSKECYWAINNDPSDDDDMGGSMADTILITCNVCAHDKPLKKYFVDDDKTSSTDSLSSRIPQLCRRHILVNVDMRAGTCIDCIKMHIYTQFRSQGPEYISCILQHPADEVAKVSEYWQLSAHAFLPKKLHEEYDRRSTDAWLRGFKKWVCPNGCQTPRMILDPNNTLGYPRVYCPVCKVEFCARCGVPWHSRITCSQHIAQNPQVLSEEERTLLTSMAQIEARRCPCCHIITLKDGGCSLITCKGCHFQYFWYMAEKVETPQATIGQNEQSTESVENKDNSINKNGIHNADLGWYDVGGFVAFRPCEMDEIRRSENTPAS